MKGVRFISAPGLIAALRSEPGYQGTSTKYSLDSIPDEIRNNAKEIFKDHCGWVLNCIEGSFEYYYSDENIIEDITCNEYEFTEEGNII